MQTTCINILSIIIYHHYYYYYYYYLRRRFIRFCTACGCAQPTHRLHMCTPPPKKNVDLLFFEGLCQKLTDFNDFWHFKFRENLTRTPRLSDVADLGKSKKVIFQHFCDYFRYHIRLSVCLSVSVCHKSELIIIIIMSSLGIICYRGLKNNNQQLCIAP